MVELLLTLLVLYGLQCAVLLPRGAALFVRPGGDWRATEGPGWRLLHPWPSASGWLASRSPLVQEEGVLCTRGPTPRFGSGIAESEGVRIAPGSGQAVEVRGGRVRVDGMTALRGTTRRHAAQAGELIAALVAEDADADAILQAARDRAFAWDAVAEARASAHDASRWLGLASDLSIVALLGALPAQAAWLGPELALLWFAPGYLVLHLVTLILLGRAHATLRPDAGDRFETLFAAALYPPLLLRAAAELRREALAGFHPAAVAAELLSRESALDFVRSELSRCTDAGERESLTAIVVRLGSTWEELFAPPVPSDSLALSYCPACRTEYRIEKGACIDCDSPLLPFPNEVPV